MTSIYIIKHVSAKLSLLTIQYERSLIRLRKTQKKSRSTTTKMSDVQELTLNMSATVEAEIVGDVTMATDAAADVIVGAEDSVGRAGAALVIFMGMKTLEAQCSLRYSPPFSSYSCLLIHPCAAAPSLVGRCSKAQSRAPNQASRAGREARVTCHHRVTNEGCRLRLGFLKHTG